MSLLYKVGILTLSDKGARGERIDESGPAIKNILTDEYEVIMYKVIPDDFELIKSELIAMCEAGCNLVLTTGGTGFSKRDVTPEATLAVATRNAPGIAEAIRANSLKITDRAMLSRAASVIRNDTIIINLPGSPKAVKESLDFILPTLKHGLDILLGRDGECARK